MLADDKGEPNKFKINYIILNSIIYYLYKLTFVIINDDKK